MADYMRMKYDITVTYLNKDDELVEGEILNTVYGELFERDGRKLIRCEENGKVYDADGWTPCKAL